LALKIKSIIKPLINAFTHRGSWVTVVPRPEGLLIKTIRAQVLSLKGQRDDHPFGMNMKTKNIVYIHSHDTGRHIAPYGHAVPTPNL